MSFQCLFGNLFCPQVGQDAIYKEDHDFVQYLSNNGFDINMLGEGGDVREVCRIRLT